MKVCSLFLVLFLGCSSSINTPEQNTRLEQVIDNDFAVSEHSSQTLNLALYVYPRKLKIEYLGDDPVNGFLVNFFITPSGAELNGITSMPETLFYSGNAFDLRLFDIDRNILWSSSYNRLYTQATWTKLWNLKPVIIKRFIAENLMPGIYTLEACVITDTLPTVAVVLEVE